ncbi:unnamed protein product, partial [Polarella glacialis]
VTKAEAIQRIRKKLQEMKGPGDSEGDNNNTNTNTNDCGGSEECEVDDDAEGSCSDLSASSDEERAKKPSSSEQLRETLRAAPSKLSDSAATAGPPGGGLGRRSQTSE